MKFERGIKMLIISSYATIECGIATFSNDIVIAIEIVFGDKLSVEVCALKNKDPEFKYNKEVTYILPIASLGDYRLVAERTFASL